MAYSSGGVDYWYSSFIPPCRKYEDDEREQKDAAYKKVMEHAKKQISIFIPKLYGDREQVCYRQEQGEDGQTHRPQ